MLNFVIYTCILIFQIFYVISYNEVPIIRPSMVLVESGLISEQVSLMRLSNIEKCILVLKQVVLIARVVLILSGLNNGTSLY